MDIEKLYSWPAHNLVTELPKVSVTGSKNVRMSLYRHNLLTGHRDNIALSPYSHSSDLDTSQDVIFTYVLLPSNGKWQQKRPAVLPVGRPEINELWLHHGDWFPSDPDDRPLLRIEYAKALVNGERCVMWKRISMHESPLQMWTVFVSG